MEENRAKLVVSIFSVVCVLCAAARNTRVHGSVNVSVGVVLDLESLGGKVGLSSMEVALSHFYASHAHYKTRLLLHRRDSYNDVVGAADAAIHLIQNVHVQALIGPNTSMQANFVIAVGEKAHVPIVTFTASSPSLTSLRSKYFIRAAQNDSTQVQAIRDIVHHFGWREAVPIYVDNEFGEGIISYLTSALQEVDCRVPYRSVIPPHYHHSGAALERELRKLMTMQTRVFIVHMSPSLASLLFTKAKEIGMMEAGYVWIMTDGITNSIDSIDHQVLDSMQGVLGIKTHVPNTKELKNFKALWKRKFQREYPTIFDAKLDTFGLWAHDAAVALAHAAEKATIAGINYENTNNSGASGTCLEFITLVNAPELLHALLHSHFKGIAGDFRLVNGQLQSSVFEILNIHGNGWKKVGSWNPNNGLVKYFGHRNHEQRLYDFKDVGGLGTIIWPGGSTSIPKGWEIPTNEKKLRIGVPVKEGFEEFVKVTIDRSTNRTSVSGFCIDVFNAVKDALQYAIPCDFIPFENEQGQPAGTYNELVYQVHLQNFDAVVGDVTIVANRSLYVDFTLPYTESGVSMIVPIVERNNRNDEMWLFLKPLTWDLWVTSGCFFVFIAFVVWVLEHDNPEFGGNHARQVGTVFWVSFSTMVFAIREKFENNLTKFVIVIWYFVVLVLTQSYTASLSSRLTVAQLQPSVNDVTLLVKNGEYVGYQNGSFVQDILKKLGFDESKLRAYKTVEDCHELFKRGSANGGISAAFDEAPYTRIFLARYCSKYTTTEPTFRTDGFGFVFPRGSPLVADVSRAILNVTEGYKMKDIEKAWLAPKTSCLDPTTMANPSTTLGLESFGGLFLVAGVAAVGALIMFVLWFLYDHWDIVTDPLYPTFKEKTKALWIKFLRRARAQTGEVPPQQQALPDQIPQQAPLAATPQQAPLDQVPQQQAPLDQVPQQQALPNQVPQQAPQHASPNQVPDETLTVPPPDPIPQQDPPHDNIV